MMYKPTDTTTRTPTNTTTKRVALPLCALLLALPGAAAAQPLNPRTLPPEEGEAKLRALLVGAGGLTSDEVARRAVATSPEIVAKRRGADVSQAKEDQATAQFWPKLQLSARYTRLSRINPVYFAGAVGTGNLADQVATGPRPILPGETLFAYPRSEIPVFLDNYQAAAQLSVPVSDYVLRLSRAVAAAEKSTAAALDEEEATRRKVAADARIAYYDWIGATGTALVLAQRLAATNVQKTDAERLFDAGMTSRADVLRAEAGVKSTELALLRARDGASLAEQRLRVIMHDGSGKPFAIGENLIAPPPAVEGLSDVEALFVEARGARPELAALRHTESALRDLEVLYGVGRLPRLDVVGSAIYANPNQRIFPPRRKWEPGWDVSVVLSWTPTDIPGANANVRETAARAAQLAAQRDAVLDGLQMEIRQAVTAVQQADASIATAIQAVHAAEASYRVRRDLFAAGKATLVEVMDAEAELTRARLEVVNAHVEARVARVRFAHAVGRDRG